MITPETTLVLARAAQDFCSILLWGGLAYLSFLVPKPLAIDLWKTLMPWYRLMVAALFGVTLAVLPVQSANLGDGWPDAWNTDIMNAVIFQSSIGAPWLCQIALASTLLLATVMLPKRMALLASVAGLFLA